MGLFILVFLFGFASIPLAYLTSLRMKKSSTGYALLVIVYLISGLILKITLSLFVMWTTISKTLIDVIQHLSRLLPVYSLTSGIQKLYLIGSYKLSCNQIDPTLLQYRCRSLDTNSTDSSTDILFGCCQRLCRPLKKCFNQMEPIEWSDNG